MWLPNKSSVLNLFLLKPRLFALVSCLCITTGVHNDFAKVACGFSVKVSDLQTRKFVWSNLQYSPVLVYELVALFLVQQNQNKYDTGSQNGKPYFFLIRIDDRINNNNDYLSPRYFLFILPSNSLIDFEFLMTLQKV